MTCVELRRLASITIKTTTVKGAATLYADLGGGEVV